MNSLPSSVNYADVLPSLPENSTRYSVALQPTSGATFGPSNQIIFQFPNRGYLIPDSIYLRYKVAHTSSAAPVQTTIQSIGGTPFFSHFQRLESQFGSVTVDSINNYNQVCNMLTNTTMDWAAKYGNAYNYGYSPKSTSSTPATTEEMDGYVLGSGSTVYTETLMLAGPLPCLLTNCIDKLLPLFAMPTISLVLTVDSINNIVNNPSVSSTFSITVCELCFDFIELGSTVDDMVRGMGDKIYIKSQSFSNSSITMPASASGSQSYIFNQRYASIKGAILLFSGPNETSTTFKTNGLFDSRDITTNNGSISLNVSGIQYPQKPYSTLNNKAAILIELRKVLGSIYDKTNNLAINSREFQTVDGTACEPSVPGKFYVGFNLQKLHSNALLTGVSTNNSNITVNIESGTATSAIVSRTLNLVLAYDALIEIDMVNKQSSVKV